MKFIKFINFMNFVNFMNGCEFYKIYELLTACEAYELSPHPDHSAFPTQKHPPRIVPPSQDKNTLLIRAKPPKIRLSRSIGRAFRLLEGD